MSQTPQIVTGMGRKDRSPPPSAKPQRRQLKPFKQGVHTAMSLLQKHSFSLLFLSFVIFFFSLQDDQSTQQFFLFWRKYTCFCYTVKPTTSQKQRMTLMTERMEQC